MPMKPPQTDVSAVEYTLTYLLRAGWMASPMPPGGRRVVLRWWLARLRDWRSPGRHIKTRTVETSAMDWKNTAVAAVVSLLFLLQGISTWRRAGTSTYRRWLGVLTILLAFLGVSSHFCSPPAQWSSVSNSAS